MMANRIQHSKFSRQRLPLPGEFGADVLRAFPAVCLQSVIRGSNFGAMDCGVVLDFYSQLRYPKI